MKIFCSEDLFWKLQTTFRNFYGRYTDLVHKFDTSVSYMLFTENNYNFSLIKAKSALISIN